VVDVVAFFSSSTPIPERDLVLRKYGVDYIYCAVAESAVLEGLLGVDPVIEKSDIVLYRFTSENSPSN
jgi:hypothetical protein